MNRPATPTAFHSRSVAAGARLERQRRDRAVPGGLEEAAERVILTGRLLLGADDARVRTPAEPEVRALEAERADHRVGGLARRDDDPLAHVAPGTGQGGQRVEVRRVVRADDEQGHGVAAIRPVGPTCAAATWV